jgi:hypothetical protein
MSEDLRLPRLPLPACLLISAPQAPAAPASSSAGTSACHLGTVPFLERARTTAAAWSATFDFAGLTPEVSRAHARALAQAHVPCEGHTLCRKAAFDLADSRATCLHSVSLPPIALHLQTCLSVVAGAAGAWHSLRVSDASDQGGRPQLFTHNVVAPHLARQMKSSYHLVRNWSRQFSALASAACG